MQTKPSPRFLRNPENDTRLLFWFAIFVMGLMFVWSFFLTSRLHQPGYAVLFSGLFGVNILLHYLWFNGAAAHRRWLPGYILVQGLLAFGVTYLSANIGMVFCLFMALIGEVLGVLHITRWSILATFYLLTLSFINFILLVGFSQARWYLLGTVPMIVFVALYVILYTRQAQANTRAQALLADLEAANRQLREYAAQVEDLTIANERQRMARELHDTLSQGLAGLILQLEAADAHLASQHTDRARAIVLQAMEKARATLAEARQAIDDLRHSEPRDLEEATRQEVERFTKATGIPCKLEIGLAGEFSDLISETALRSVSECLTNIARHAQARTASLRLMTGEGQLTVEVSDDGIGFDPAGVQAGHYGLLGMHERIRLAGGSVEVCSEPGQGTHIQIRFPLENVAHG